MCSSNYLFKYQKCEKRFKWKLFDFMGVILIIYLYVSNKYKIFWFDFLNDLIDDLIWKRCFLSYIFERQRKKEHEHNSIAFFFFVFYVICFAVLKLKYLLNLMIFQPKYFNIFCTELKSVLCGIWKNA
jgi:hypothetical protein